MSARFRNLIAAGAAACLLAGVGAARAVIIDYSDDRTGFDAASGAASIGALPAGPLGNLLSMSVGSVTFKWAGTSNNFLGFFDYSNEIAGNELAVNSYEDFDMDIAGGAYSIGFYIHDPGYAGANSFTTGAGRWGCAPGGTAATCVSTRFLIEILDGSVSLGSFFYTPPTDTSDAVDGSVGFFGVHSSQAFNRVLVRDLSKNADNEYFGGFLLGLTAPAPPTPGLPEPGAALLTATALAAAIAARRRRSRR